MKFLYAMLTRLCDLDCPHCDIKRDTEEFGDWNEERFIENLKNFNGVHHLFGGEPFLNKERFLKAAPYADSVSTNLLLLDDDIAHTLYKYGIGVSSSWNPDRFTEKQYKKWRNNLRYIADMRPGILVTLTPSLVDSSEGTRAFYKMFEECSGYFDSLKMEPVIAPGTPQEFYDRADEWLCNLYKNLTEKQRAQIDNFQHDEWYFDCSGNYTMNPDGTMRPGCPHYEVSTGCQKCLSCEHAEYCLPCRMQEHCTAPKKLLALLQNEKRAVI